MRRPAPLSSERSASATSSGRSSWARWPSPGRRTIRALGRSALHAAGLGRPDGAVIAADHEHQRHLRAAAGRAPAGRRSQFAIIPNAAATWPGRRASRRVELESRARRSWSRCRAAGARPRPGSAARQAKSRGTMPVQASSLASGEKSWPGDPAQRQQRAVQADEAAWARSGRPGTSGPGWRPRPSGRPPWPGAMPSAARRAAEPAAMPGSDRPSGSGGIEVKPWPGRSGATTVKCRASSGARSRQEWVAAPVPWTSRMAGPLPITCTCQRRPAGLDEAAGLAVRPVLPVLLP